jgi:predicted nucleotidyltransferase
MGEPGLSIALVKSAVVPLLAPYARRLFLFGSVASGEAVETSDVDILVELKPAKERPPLGLRWFGLERELAALLGRQVDLVSDDAVSPHLRPFIERQKVLLYAEG